MAIKKALPVRFEDVFPAGAAVTTEVEPVMEYKDGRSTGRQEVDPVTELPVWQVTVMDADPDVKGPSKSVKVKIFSKVQPVPPPGLPGFESIRPVEFDGMTAKPYPAEVMNGRYKVAWTLTARSMSAPLTVAEVAAKTPAASSK